MSLVRLVENCRTLDHGARTIAENFPELTIRDLERAGHSLMVEVTGRSASGGHCRPFDQLLEIVSYLKYHTGSGSNADVDCTVAELISGLADAKQNP